MSTFTPSKRQQSILAMAILAMAILGMAILGMAILGMVGTNGFTNT